MKNRKWIAAAAVITIAALALTGCSDPTTSSSSGSSGTKTWPSPTASLKGVKLTIWTAESTASVPNSVIAAFDKATGAKVTNVTVPDQYETNVQTRLATGDKPDVMLWQATGSELTEIKAGSQLLNLNGAPWLKLLNKPSQQIGVFNGVHYAVPIKAPSIIGVYYNKQDFAKAGITSTPSGYDGLVSAGKALKAAGVPSPIYEAAKDNWPTQWCPDTQVADLAASGFWTRMNENKDSFSNPAFVQAIANCQSLYKNYGNANIGTATFVDQAAALWSGEAGMAIQVNALVDQISAGHTLSDINKKIGYFPISPKGNVGTAITEQTNTLVAFKTDAVHEAATRQFLEYWEMNGYASFIKKLGYVSLQPKVPSPPTVPTISKENVAAAVKTIVGSMQNEAVDNPDLYLNMVDMYAGLKTPAEVAQVTQAQFVQLAKAQGVKGF